MFFLRRKAANITWRTIQFLTVLGLIALLIHPLFISRQTNLPVVGLALPASIALAMLVARGRAFTAMRSQRL